MKNIEIDLIKVNLLKRLTRAIWSRSIYFINWKDQKIKDLKIKRSNSQPCQLVLWSGLGIWSSVFRSNRSFFVIARSIWSRKISNLPMIFFKDWWDRFAHGQSFLKINGIDSLTVNLFKRLMIAIFSWLIFFKDRKDQKIEDHKIKISNS